MQPRSSLVIATSLVMILGLVMPVSALNFDLIYFETDQLTYEVGESINMVANMIADFSGDGWCYVSFSIITDQGLVFDDGFFISPSPNPRLVSSLYTILPEHTSPYPDPIVAQVSLNVEIFDKYYQGINEIIEVNITRGHLQAQSVAPLLMQTNKNATLAIQVTSTFNESIVLSNEDVLIEIFDSENSLVFSNLTTTASNGECHLQWNQVPFLPGDYSIDISGNGTNAFLPFSDTLPLTVTPEHSDIIRIDNTDELYCRTPSGIFESAHIIVQHVNDTFNPITSSNVTWSTSFGNGTFIPTIEGQYECIIPFNTSPGQYILNITASNPSYQEAVKSYTISIIPRNVSMWASTKQILSTNKLKVDVTLQDFLEDEPLAYITLNLSISLNGWFDSYEDATNLTGQISCIIQIPEEIWGSTTIDISVQSSILYSQENFSIPIEIIFEPVITINNSSSFIRGFQAFLNISIYNPLGNGITSISIDIYDSENHFVTSFAPNSMGSYLAEWIIESDTPIGYYNYTLSILPNSYYAANISRSFEVHITYPLWVTPFDSNWVFIRGTISNQTVFLESEDGIVGSILVCFQSTTGEFQTLVEIDLLVSNNITFTLPSNVTKGIHMIQVILLHENFSLFQPIFIEAMVLSPISSEISNPVAYYQDSLEFDLAVLDDFSQPLSSVTLQIIDGESQEILIQSYSANLDNPQSILLPEWFSPGFHIILVDIVGSYTITNRVELNLTVWIRTTIQLTVITDLGGQMVVHNDEIWESYYKLEIIPRISSGSISSPPPILFNGTTSEPSDTLATSFTSCPKLSSGTSNFSTVFEKFLTSLSGNGHMVLSLRDLKTLLLSFMACSTDLEVQPNDTTPHFDSRGPCTTTSVRNSV